MMLSSRVMTGLLLIAAFALGQSASLPSKTIARGAGGSPSSPAPQSPANALPADQLKMVLAQMNHAAPRFQTFQADFEWENYYQVVKETDIQKGHAYFRRKVSGKGSYMDVLFNFTAAAADGKQVVTKQFLYKDNKFHFYELKMNRITEGDADKHKSDIDAFLSLGLGGSGDDLLASFEVKWQGGETVDDVKATKLEVTGKSPSVQQKFSKAVLWIDPARDIAIKQQFFQTSGDYRLIRYHNIEYNDKVSDNVFRLKTTGTPEIVKPGPN